MHQTFYHIDFTEPKVFEELDYLPLTNISSQDQRCVLGERVQSQFIHPKSLLRIRGEKNVTREAIL